MVYHDLPEQISFGLEFPVSSGKNIFLPPGAGKGSFTAFLPHRVCLFLSPPDNSLSLASVTYNFYSHVTLAHTRLSWLLWFLLTLQTFCFSFIANYTLHLAFLGSDALES